MSTPTHLPECPVIVYESIGQPYVVPSDLCICWRLRAAEERVRKDYRANRLDLAHYEDGVQAARGAVEALQLAGEGPAYCAGVYDALAAIDAVRRAS